MLKKNCFALVLLLCISMAVSSTAYAGIFDGIEQKEQIPATEIIRLPSYTQCKGVAPDEIEAQDDGSTRCFYRGVAELNFYEFGDYLEQKGYAVTGGSKETENGYEMLVESDGKSFTVIYNPNSWELTTIYPNGYNGKAIYEYGKYQIGSIVTFGYYFQQADGKDRTPIEWVVLDADWEEGKILVISRCGLDARCFDESGYLGWDKSEIRAWLNSTFLNTAFTASEQAGIMTTTVSTPDYEGNSGGSDTEDKIWLLSREEAERYFASNEARKAVPTEYAVAQGAWQNGGSDSAYKLDGVGCCWWWLRSPGIDSYRASNVNGGGSIYGSYVYFSYGSVRPAFWLNLDSAAIN